MRRTCAHCGKRFESSAHYVKYCSKKCEQAARVEREAAKKKRARTERHDADVKEALRNGITYGQQKAKETVAMYGRVNVADVMEELNGDKKPEGKG